VSNSSNQGFGSITHLAGRFFGALSPAGPPADDELWVRGQLVPGEQELWARMSGPDRRHAVGVARDSITLIDEGGHGEAPRPVVAAALLHDVGKVESRLGTWARAGVTVVAMVAGRERVASWADRPMTSGRKHLRVRDLPGAAGRYVTHDRIGSDLLEQAGSDPLTVAWAGEHHRPESTWTVPRQYADALKEADGD
jgi:hypothetical protein